MTKPKISIIIISYNMGREVPRTVQSFCPPYQEDVSADDVEILVMENGSSQPIRNQIIDNWPSNVRYINVETPQASPAKALNLGAELARGEWVCPVIDGARMVTPGVLKHALRLMKMHDNPVIATLGWHLGDKPQQDNVEHGYTQDVEDELLRSISWPKNGYQLFDISSLGGSAKKAWLAPIAESNVLFLKKNTYFEMGGYDEAFDIPGGGLVNLDFFKRAIEDVSREYVLMMSEASFHQYHGGVSTSRSVGLPSVEDETRTTWQIYAEQYEAIRGVPFRASERSPLLYGDLHPQLHAVLRSTAKSFDG